MRQLTLAAPVAATFVLVPVLLYPALGLLIGGAVVLGSARLLRRVRARR